MSLENYQPLLSLITVTYNSDKTIARTLDSVAAQSYPSIEHIIVDGLSKDNTVSIAQRYPHVSKIISEEDSGMYDAVNKGINTSTGKIIGVLNGDDAYADSSVVEKIIHALSDKSIDAIYGDIAYVDENEDRVRYFYSNHFEPNKFRYGHMPAHPSYYARRKVFVEHGIYKTDYRIAADFELLVRHLYTGKTKTRFLPICMVNMRIGGMSNSSLRNRWIVNSEMVRACREHGLKTNMWNMTRKIPRKLLEYFLKNPNQV